jgi:hypothetical protein
MSTILGSPGDRLPLARAIDALAESARQAGRPGFVWIAGLFYPAIGVGIAGTAGGPLAWTLPESRPRAVRVEVATAEPIADFLLESFGSLAATPVVAILLLPLFRLVAGLARSGSADAWNAASEGRRTPRLRTLWRLGRGLTLPTYGLWLQLVLMQILAFLVMLAPIVWVLGGPALHSEADRIAELAARGLLVGPVILFFALYLLAISVLGQLALQSLVENRRGVSSALLHAWRLVRHDPAATARAAGAELLLLVLAVGAVRAFAGILGGLPGHEGFVVALQIALAGFAGVVRAGYWARAYRALGGLTPADGVPGLARA